VAGEDVLGKPVNDAVRDQGVAAGEGELVPACGAQGRVLLFPGAAYAFGQEGVDPFGGQ